MTARHFGFVHHERTFASIANSVPWRSPGVLFGVKSRWTITRLLGGPNHRLDANLHIPLRWFARFETLMRMTVRPCRAVPTHPADAPMAAGFSGRSSGGHRRCDSVAVPPGRQAPATSPRDKKELLRAVLEEVIITVNKDHNRAHLTLRWRGD